MTKKQLEERANRAVSEITAALQTLYDGLNAGQKKKLQKDEAAGKVLNRYGVKL